MGKAGAIFVKGGDCYVRFAHLGPHVPLKTVQRVLFPMTGWMSLAKLSECLDSRDNFPADLFDAGDLVAVLQVEDELLDPGSSQLFAFCDQFV